MYVFLQSLHLGDKDAFYFGWLLLDQQSIYEFVGEKSFFYGRLYAMNYIVGVRSVTISVLSCALEMVLKRVQLFEFYSFCYCH